MPARIESIGRRYSVVSHGRHAKPSKRCLFTRKPQMFANETNANIRKTQRSPPAVVFPCELPLQFVTTRTTFLPQPLVLILLQQQRYHLTHLRFANQPATTTLLKEYTLPQRNRDLCNRFHGHRIDENVLMYTIDLVPTRTQSSLDIHHYNSQKLMLMVSTWTLRIDRVQELWLQSITASVHLIRTRSATLLITVYKVSNFLILSSQS